MMQKKFMMILAFLVFGLLVSGGFFAEKVLADTPGPVEFDLDSDTSTDDGLMIYYTPGDGTTSTNLSGYYINGYTLDGSTIIPDQGIHLFSNDYDPSIPSLVGNAATLSLDSGRSAYLSYWDYINRIENGLLADATGVSVGSMNVDTGDSYSLNADDSSIFVGSDIGGIQHGLTVDATSTTLTGGTNSSTAYIDNNEAWISVGTDDATDPEITLIRAINNTNGDIPGPLSTNVTIGDTANNYVTVDSLTGTTVTGDSSLRSTSGLFGMDVNDTNAQLGYQSGTLTNGVQATAGGVVLSSTDTATPYSSTVKLDSTQAYISFNDGTVESGLEAGPAGLMVGSTSGSTNMGMTVDTFTNDMIVGYMDTSSSEAYGLHANNSEVNLGYNNAGSFRGVTVNNSLISAYSPDAMGAAGMGLGQISIPMGPSMSGAYIGYDNGTNYNGLVSAGLGTAVGSINYSTGEISGLVADGSILMVGYTNQTTGAANGLVANSSEVVVNSFDSVTSNEATLSLNSTDKAYLSFWDDANRVENGLLATVSDVSVGSMNYNTGASYSLNANGSSIFVGSDIGGIQHGLTVDATSTTLTGGTNSSTAFIDNNEAWISVGTDTAGDPEVTLIRATNLTDVGGSTNVTIGNTANNYIEVDSTNGTTVHGDLNVTGNLSINGTTFSQDTISTNGDLAVNGNTTLGNAITDSTTVSGTLSVAGATTTHGITNTGNITNSGNISTATLQTSGLATLNSAQVNNNLTVNGNTIMGNALTDSTTVNGTLSVSGATTTNGITNTGNIATTTLNTTGLATLNSAQVNTTLNVDGATTTNGITNTGNIATTTLNTTGLATLNSAQVNTTLNVDGATTLAGSLDVAGATTTNGITNTGNITTDTLNTTGDTNVGGSLFVSGATTLTGDLVANGTNNTIGTAGVSTNTITGVDNNITATGNNFISGDTNSITATTSNTIGVSGGSTITTTADQVTALTADGSGFTATNSGNVTVLNTTGHGLIVSPTETIVSGGTTSTTLTLNNTGATFRNTVTGGPARVSGVADGVNDTDAVNFRQYSVLKDGVEKANMGIASVSALSAIPAALPGKRVALGAGYGYFEDESAIAIGVKARVLDNMSVSAGIGVGISDTSSTYTANAGFSFSF